MNKKFETIKDGILVTIGGLLALATAFTMYFLIFMFIETVANKDASYNFVSSLRVGYGIVWIVLCLIIYRTRVPEWLKASILVGSLTTFMAGFGVQLYKTPIVVGLVMFLVSAVGVFLLFLMKKKWYHYYALVISVIAALIYL